MNPHINVLNCLGRILVAGFKDCCFVFSIVEIRIYMLYKYVLEVLLFKQRKLLFKSGPKQYLNIANNLSFSFDYSAWLCLSSSNLVLISCISYRIILPFCGTPLYNDVGFPNG